MAIGIILGILFVLMAVACVFVGVCMLSGRKPFVSGARGITAKRPVAGGISLGAAVLSFVLFLFIPFSFHTVQAGEVAVFKHLG
ncbi:MAG: hypothetical protein K2K60_00400, partial [Clostridia bacterium]|nr:hypothetical protein [Clostridia bacterium]